MISSYTNLRKKFNRIDNDNTRDNEATDESNFMASKSNFDGKTHAHHMAYRTQRPTKISTDFLRGLTLNQHKPLPEQSTEPQSFAVSQQKFTFCQKNTTERQNLTQKIPSKIVTRYFPVLRPNNDLRHHLHC